MNHTPYPRYPLQNVTVVPPLGPRYPVPGTNVSLCPPHGYSWNEKSRAWESTQHEGRIKVLQFKGQSFIQRKARLEQLLIPDGKVDWQERREGRHNGYDCLHLGFRINTPTLLAEVQTVSCHRVFAFGDNDVLLLSTASFPATFSKKMEGEILASMLSVIYHPDGIFGDLPAHARFSLDLQPAKLVWQETSHANPDGPFVFTSKAETHSSGIQVTVEIKNGHPQNVRKAVENLFQRNFFSKYQILEVHQIQVQELSGYEGYAIEQNTVHEINRLEYVAILLMPESHITFTCIAPDDRITHLTSFRKLIKSYRQI